MPVQVVVLPVRDDHDDYARDVAASLGAAAVRVEVDVANEPLNARIRRWKVEKVPYILVVGDSDVAARTVGVNARSSPRPKRDVVLDDFVAALAIEIETKGSPETDSEREPSDPVGK